MALARSLGPPLVAELSGLSPWEACRRLASLPHVVFFDSAGHSPQSRFSYVSADPLTWLQSPAAPFEAVSDLWRGCRLDAVAGLPPFQGGVAGLFGYELARHLEALPSAADDDFQTPELAVGFYDWVFSFDHARNKGWLIVTGLPETDPLTRQANAKKRLDQIRRWLDQAPAPRPFVMSPTSRLSAPQYPVPGRASLSSNFDRVGYLAILRRGIEYIHAGDCFQVNLAQRLLAPQTAAPLELYDRLRTRNAAPFAGFLDMGEFALASASPERFLLVANGEVETRPIKGTRPRGLYPMEDMNRSGDLLESDKDRAENVMIVDLLRNDLGRVCEFGSVNVSSVCQLESYPFVHHLVSEVRGRLRPGLDALDLLKATFPGGSVTGAPKIRAMQIITELERTARGPYCGSLGYLGFDGSMDLNLLIRTMTIGKGWVHFSVGGGIVADSVPEREYEETWHKAAGLLKALEE